MTDKIKYFLLFIILSFNFQPSIGQVIENYDAQILILGGSEWLTSPDMAKVTVDLDGFPLVDIGITVPANVTVFIDGAVWFFAEADTSFTTPSRVLRKKFSSAKSSREVVIYKPGIKEGEISIKKGIFGASMPLNTKVVRMEPSNLRTVNEVDHFFLVAGLIIFSLIALFKVVYPLVISIIIRPISVFSSEDISESNSLTKFFSEEILFFLIIFNMLLMLLIMVISHYLDFVGWENFIVGDLNQMYFIWLSGTGVLLVLSWMRFAWLKMTAIIFGINKFEFTHFFYMLRFASLLLMVMFAVLYICVINESLGIINLIHYLLLAFFVIYIIGIFLLYFIMTKKVSFKNYHLFSYLCTAELVPFLVLSKLILG